MRAAKNKAQRRLFDTLEALLAATPVEARIATDPLRFPRRYREARDVEVAAFIAAGLAFGRVSAFGPILEKILGAAEGFGGPAEFATTLDARGERALAGIYYRWHPNPDIVGLVRLAGRAVNTRGNIGAFFEPGPMLGSLGNAIDALRLLVPPDVSPHFRTFLTHPEDGSACKRWCMLTRWMVRTGSPDLGLWTHLSPSDLVIPVDTHVFRVARFLGLTRRNAANWTTAEQITAALAELSPADPVRYDFALAHLGISGDCRGHRDIAICPGCPLDSVCQAPERAKSG